MDSIPTFAACSASAQARFVVAAPTCLCARRGSAAVREWQSNGRLAKDAYMMLVTRPLFSSAAISAILLFSSSSIRTLSPVPPAIQNPWTPACMLYLLP